MTIIDVVLVLLLIAALILLYRSEAKHKLEKEELRSYKSYTFTIISECVSSLDRETLERISKLAHTQGDYTVRNLCNSEILRKYIK